MSFVSDHSSLSAVISTAQPVRNLCVSRKVFLKHQVNWNTVCGAMRDLPWSNIWSSANPVEVLNKHLSLLVGRYVPTKIIRVRNKDKPWFDDQCRRAFDLKQEAHLWWCVIALGLIGNSSSSSSSSSSRTDRWVHFQQNAGLRLFVHT